jgi:hypothetical protein
VALALMSSFVQRIHQYSYIRITVYTNIGRKIETQEGSLIVNFFIDDRMINEQQLNKVS